MAAPSAWSVHADAPVGEEDYRDIPPSERDAMPDADFAGKGESFPIKTAADVAAAAHAIGRAGADNYDAATLKRNIIRIATRKGFALPAAWKADLRRDGPDKFKGLSLIGNVETGGAVAQSWIQVAKTGEFVSARYGEFAITKDHLRQMLSNFQSVMPQKPTRLPVDYDHLSMDPQKPGDGIAAGWFVDLELRDQGATLWGLVDWTPTAAEAISNKEYQYVSPSFARNYTAKDGKKIGTTLLAAAITNHPFLEGMAPLTLCADGDLAIVLTDRGDRLMADEIVTAGKSYTLKDTKGNPVEVNEDEMANCAYVKSLAAKLPKEGEKVVKMHDVVDASEVVNLREKVTTLAADLTAERDARKAQIEEVRLDKAKARVETLIKDGKALPTEKEFALELAKEHQGLFDKWAGTHTKKLIELNREFGSSEGAELDTDDPVQHLTQLVAQEQKGNAALTFEKAWQLACDKHPDAYRAYTDAVAQRV